MWARLTSLVPWRKLLVFKKNDSPLARGRLQNAKWKEQCPNRIISELPNLSQKPGRLARENIEAAERAFCELGGPFGFLRATCGQRGQRVGITYDMAAAKFSTVWKSFQRIFHTMENIWPIFPRNGKTFRQFSTQWKNFEGFFPQCGKLGFKAVLGGFRLLARGC